MIKRDINGNTVSRDKLYLVRLLNNLKRGKFSIDGYNCYMIETGDGGQIVFYGQDAPVWAKFVEENFILIN